MQYSAREDSDVIYSKPYLFLSCQSGTWIEIRQGFGFVYQN